MTSIPIRPKRGRKPVCPRGTYQGTVHAITHRDDEYTIIWLIDTPDQVFKVPQVCDGEGLADVVADLGITGDSVELGDIRGNATCHVRTFGGRKEAKVVDTDPAIP